VVEEEAFWIRNALACSGITAGMELLDVGSSTRRFRTQTQPYIEEQVFAPLRRRGVQVYHLDQKSAEGVDFVVDINDLNAGSLGKIFDVVLCSSMLEHVRFPEKISRVLLDMVKPAGMVLVTVPRVYRYHPDPVDTGFRPSFSQLLALFPGTEVLAQAKLRVNGKNWYHYTPGERVRYAIPCLRWKIMCILVRKPKE
jgi:2-polyprenyl-3-methyl-5-hydroxy-6-metoxy-1,4-benzoquinol methylase